MRCPVFLSGGVSRSGLGTAARVGDQPGETCGLGPVWRQPISS